MSANFFYEAQARSILNSVYDGKQALPDGVCADGTFWWANNDPETDDGVCSDHGEFLNVGCRSCDPEDYAEIDGWLEAGGEFPL